MAPTSDKKSVHPMPFVRMELAVLTVNEGELDVLLARRAEAPFAGRWALPGGVLRIDLDLDLGAASQRVARERLGVELPGASQLAAVGGRSRDPRAPWALSVVYRCTTTPDQLALQPGKRVNQLRWVKASAAAADDKLAFDHGRIIEQAVVSLRQDVENLKLPMGLMTEPFTLGELQATCEAVLGRTLDKSSFRRRVDAAGCVEMIRGEMRAGPFRPAQLYRNMGS